MTSSHPPLQVFPILIGETGSAFETSDDKQWLQDFADYMNAEVRPCVRVCMSLSACLHVCMCVTRLGWSGYASAETWAVLECQM
jgi:hypothetical protein